MIVDRIKNEVNLTKDMPDLYTKDYTPLLRKAKDTYIWGGL